MSAVNFGNHVRLVAATNMREKIRAFYGEYLGCQVKPHAEKPTDIMIFANESFVGINYESTTLSREQHLLGAWLEIKADDPKNLKTKLLEFGVQEIEYPDKANFYFQGPCGQVYRLAQK